VKGIQKGDIPFAGFGMESQGFLTVWAHTGILDCQKSLEALPQTLIKGAGMKIPAGLSQGLSSLLMILRKANNVSGGQNLP